MGEVMHNWNMQCNYDINILYHEPTAPTSQHQQQYLFPFPDVISKRQIGSNLDELLWTGMCIMHDQ